LPNSIKPTLRPVSRILLFSKRFLKQDNAAPVLILFSSTLLWMDSLPRAMAVVDYPVWLYDPVFLNQWIPGEFACKFAIACFCTAMVGFIIALKSLRWGCMIVTVNLVLFLSIYWSFFPQYSHGGTLTLVCAITTSIFLLFPKGHQTSTRPVYICTIQVIIALMFASAAYYKLNEPGWTWCDGFEIQKRVFASYSADGRSYSFIAKAIMENTVLGQFAGILELFTQTAVLPLLVLSLWYRKARIPCFACAILASLGIHVGMKLFLFEFLPLLGILLIPSSIPRNFIPQKPTQWLAMPCLALIACANAFISFQDKERVIRKAYPLSNYTMFSSTFPEENLRWRLKTQKELSAVQKEFFLLFSTYIKWPRRDLDAFARAHEIDPEELQPHLFQLSNWMDTKQGVPEPG
jgi:hypothetical protein